MEICAAIQAEKSGRVYLILRDKQRYRWARAAAGQQLSRPFYELSDLFAHMASVEGKTAQQWRDAFRRIYPDWEAIGEPPIYTAPGQNTRLEA